MFEFQNLQNDRPRRLVGTVALWSKDAPRAVRGQNCEITNSTAKCSWATLDFHTQEQIPLSKDNSSRWCFSAVIRDILE